MKWRNDKHKEVQNANNHLRGMVETMFSDLESYKKECRPPYAGRANAMENTMRKLMNLD